jgi:hypothetical protein
MQCQGCGMLMPDENNYCGNCGKPLQGSRILFKDLVMGGVIKAGDKISCRHKRDTVEAIVQADGTLEVGGKIYNSPPEAIVAVRGVACDSWHCWRIFDPAENRDRPIHSLKPAFKRKQASTSK